MRAFIADTAVESWRYPRRDVTESGCVFTRAIERLYFVLVDPELPVRLLLCAGRGSGWCPRRDSCYRDGRERRELLGRAEERLGRDEEPGGPLQRLALRGQERSRWTATLSHTQTHARAKRRRPEQEQGDSLYLTLRIFLGCWAYFKQRLFYVEKQVCYGKQGDFKLQTENIKCQHWSEHWDLKKNVNLESIRWSTLRQLTSTSWNIWLASRRKVALSL